MMNQKLETESNCYSDYKKSEDAVGRLESKKKLKKVRSIRLIRLSSMRSSTRSGNTQHDNLSMLSSVGTESSWQPTPNEFSDASPNYMKATSSSHAKESFQNTRKLFTRKTLTRISTLKLKRSWTRKLSGRTELKRKLKSSKIIKVATVKGLGSTRKLSKSIYGSDSDKSQRVMTRRLSLKPVRILTKIPTFKSKKSFIEKSPQISQSPDSRLLKATCSSTLKDSHFANHIDIPQEASGSQGVSAMKVCPYSYCSLHSHHHRDNVPALKRFVSMRRRLLRTQKSVKMNNHPASRSKQSGKNTRKATQKSQIVCSDDIVNETAHSGRSHSRDTQELARDSHVRPHDTPASTSTIDAKSSASDIEISEGEITTKGKTMETGYEVPCVSSPHKDDNSGCNTKVAYRMQERDNKYIKMWHLMYKNAVLNNTGKVEKKLPLSENDKEGQGQDDLPLNRVNSSSSGQDFCETDQDMDDENENVIEMVQKAFDEILLPESEDPSSDDHFKSGGIGSDEVLLEKSEGERQERNTRESPKENRWLKVDNFRSQEEDMAAVKMRTKPDQKSPNSWSNLKKLILLKRFVKALEKVRNFNLRRPRHLPSDANLEAEKVVLKHLTAEERKNAEDWMIDHALQKVISKLGPAQRRRVALLVEAFETILPFQDAENGTQSSATVETQANPIQPLDDSSDCNRVEANIVGDYGYPHNIVMESADNASDKPVPEMHNPHNMPASGATDEDLGGRQCLSSGCDNGEQRSTINDNEEAPTNEIVNEVPEELMSNSNTDIPNRKSESTGRDFETKNLLVVNGERFSMSKSLILKGLVRSLGSNLVVSGAPSDQLDEPAAESKEGIEKTKPETEELEGFLAHEQSDAPKRAIVDSKTQPEKQNYTGLWYLVYKHMVSGVGENNSKPLIDGTDEKELGYNSSRARGTSISYESTPVINEDMHFKDQGVVDPEVEFQQNEAIKMVEDAIDSIILDDVENLTDGQSLTDNTISDNSKQSHRTEKVHGEDLNQNQERVASGNGITQDQEEEPGPKEGDKPNRQLPRSWSNLRKVILLRRFIKALEKVRKFNPSGPRYLPIEPDFEAEKVHLRHQDMVDRKGTEEWMLDYALRQVVSKLTPARKRKVELLVEAFETVMPTIQT